MEEQNIKVAVDAIVFGYNHNQLHVLLVRQKYGPMQDRWVLVGGFLQNGESLQSAMERELQEETGLSIKYRFCTAFSFREILGYIVQKTKAVQNSKTPFPVRNV